MTGTVSSSTPSKGHIPDIESLCKEYCPPLEAGLVYALASDFDLTNSQSLAELRKTLDDLRESAVFEQDLELLPTDIEDLPDVITGPHHDGQHQKHENVSSKRSVTSPLGTTEDEANQSGTTASSALWCSDVDDSDVGHKSVYGEAGLDFERLSQEEKCTWLGNMFPTAKQQDVKDVLARCGGNFDRSTDELLNISFLRESAEGFGEQEYIAPRGVDGFMQNDVKQSQRNARGKDRRSKNRKDYKDINDLWTSDSALSSGTATPNMWKALPEDVKFIASRTRLKSKIITSVYHANNLQIAPTIRALAIREGEAYTGPTHTEDDIMELQMDELRIDFGHVPDTQLFGVLMLANNIPSAAKDLLDVMMTSNKKPVLLGKVTGLASYTPINLSDDEAKPKKVSGNSWPSAVSSSGGVYTTSHLSNAQGLAATQAFNQASAAYRRGKSDHLMGGAAAYYASVGHEKLKAAKSIQAAAADSHVAAQSSPTTLDLHGVIISDAVRIAQKGTEAWWEGLGDRKYVVGGKGDGYRIITGVGRHSSDGIGRIGPAVSKMLVKEGWKVEVGRGEIIVSGRARK